MAVTEQECTLYRRIATGGPDTIQRCIQILRENGFDAPQTRNELARDLAKCAIQDPGVIPQIAECHPDLLFIMENMSEPTAVAQVASSALSKKNNDCGCSGKRNDTGSETNVGSSVMPAPGKSNVTSEVFSSNVIIVLLSIVVLGGAAVFFSVLVRALVPQSK